MNMRRDRVAWGLLLVAALTPALWADATPVVDPNAYVQHVRILSSDALEGRGTGSPGERKAAAYIADHFESLGCEPAGENGTYFQDFDVRELPQVNDAAARFEIVGTPLKPVLWQDWCPLAFGKAEAYEGAVVFAGYGVSNGDEEYDDYAGVEVAGKVALIMRQEPPRPDGKPRREPTEHAFFARKAKTAQRHGAVGLIVVDPPGEEGRSDRLYPFMPQMALFAYELPMVHVTEAVADELLQRGGVADLATLARQIDRTRAPASQELKDVRVRIDPAIESRMLRGRNVLGILPGAGDTDDIIVIGGHYDHLGWGFARDSGGQPVIYNGADDNASGTAGVLELARLYATGPRPRCDVMFIAFSGEEIGLVGSRHFVEHPTVPLERVRLMFNLDMIGRQYGRTMVIYGVDSARGLRRLVRRIVRELDLSYRSLDAFGGLSDHAPFGQRDIPTLGIFAGMHADYHAPTDDWELIDVTGATQIVDLAYRLTFAVADLNKRPEPR